MVLLVRLFKGDIAKVSGSALVTSANDSLVGNEQPLYWRFASRQNVDGAVRLAGGAGLREACLGFEATVAEAVLEGPMRDISRWERTAKVGTSRLRRCSVGDCVATRGFGALDVDFVIHAVAPDSEYQGDELSPSLRLLRSAYDRAFGKAEALECATLALPSLGSGVKAWPPAISSAVALDVLRSRQDTSIKEVTFVVGDDAARVAWTRVAKTLLGEPSELRGDAFLWHFDDHQMPDFRLEELDDLKPPARPG